MAKHQRADAADREKAWKRGFNRRTLLKGRLGVEVAALAQRVTTRLSYTAPGDTSEGTLVNIFLRGHLDGQSALVLADDPNLFKARPDLAVRSTSLIPLGRGFGLHPAIAPLRPLIDAGMFAAIPAVSTPDLSHYPDLNREVVSQTHVAAPDDRERCV